VVGPVGLRYTGSNGEYSGSDGRNEKDRKSGAGYCAAFHMQDFDAPFSGNLVDSPHIACPRSHHAHVARPAPPPNTNPLRAQTTSSHQQRAFDRSLVSALVLRIDFRCFVDVLGVRYCCDHALVHDGQNLKGWLLGFVLGTIGKRVLEKAFENSVKAIEGRNGAGREARPSCHTAQQRGCFRTQISQRMALSALRWRHGSRGKAHSSPGPPEI